MVCTGSPLLNTRGTSAWSSARRYKVDRRRLSGLMVSRNKDSVAKRGRKRERGVEVKGWGEVLSGPPCMSLCQWPRDPPLPLVHSESGGEPSRPPPGVKTLGEGQSC